MQLIQCFEVATCNCFIMCLICDNLPPWCPGSHKVHTKWWSGVKGLWLLGSGSSQTLASWKPVYYNVTFYKVFGRVYIVALSFLSSTKPKTKDNCNEPNNCYTDTLHSLYEYSQDRVWFTYLYFFPFSTCSVLLGPGL